MFYEKELNVQWEDLLFAAMFRGDKLSDDQIPELTQRQKERLREVLAEISQQEEQREQSAVVFNRDLRRLG